ncbi:MAG: hypothetical protein HY324_03775 [Chlamydiia bacterium]|nr:hypothetical protein [Chlamydiia bacterium]
MYLAIAQRIDLPLEIITPPGHIYVRYREGDRVINIETTARGVDMPDETYLNIQNSTLMTRTLKEVIGMTHVNQASTYLYKGEYGKAVHAYEAALPYMQEDPLVHELLGYSYLFTGEKEKGEAFLKRVGKGTHAIVEDYLAGKVDLDGIEAVFQSVDEKRESILQKQQRLQQVLKKYPDFRGGLHQLAISWIQLSRSKEAIAPLLHYYTLDPQDALTAYYLAVLYDQRQDYQKCWRYLREAEALTAADHFSPKVLRALRRTLSQHSPEP